MSSIHIAPGDGVIQQSSENNSVNGSFSSSVPVPELHPADSSDAVKVGRIVIIIFLIFIHNGFSLHH